jgi:hypothetical protein
MARCAPLRSEGAEAEVAVGGAGGRFLGNRHHGLARRIQGKSHVCLRVAEEDCADVGGVDRARAIAQGSPGRAVPLPEEASGPRYAHVLARLAGKSATVLEAFAPTEGSPARMSAGSVTKEPPPATAFIAPARKPAPTSTHSVWLIPAD